MLRLIIPLILFFFLGCNAEHKPPGKYLLTREQFISVLVDVHLVNAVQTTSEFYELITEYDSIDLHSDIFEKHNIKKAAFDSTFSYYSKKPDYMTGVYNEVIMRLSKLQDSIRANE